MRLADLEWSEIRNSEYRFSQSIQLPDGRKCKVCNNVAGPFAGTYDLIYHGVGHDDHWTVDPLAMQCLLIELTELLPTE